MAIELKSTLRNPQLRLAFKAVLFGGFLSLVYIGNFGFFPILLFIVAALILYSKPLFNTLVFFNLFLILLILPLLFVGLTPNGWFFAPAAALFSFLFYVMLGLKNLIFVNRFHWYYLLHLLLLYALFLFFFLSDKLNNFFLISLAVFLIALFLLRELFKLAPYRADLSRSSPKAMVREGSGSGFAPRLHNKRRLLASWTLSLIVVEMVWAISLLPMGFLNSSILALLVIFVLGDLTLYYFQGALNRRIILSRAVTFALLALLVFAASKWSI